MGQNTEDMLDGLTCSTCGVYFAKAHGHPVQCQSCKRTNPQQGVPQARNKEL